MINKNLHCYFYGTCYPDCTSESNDNFTNIIVCFCAISDDGYCIKEYVEDVDIETYNLNNKYGVWEIKKCSKTLANYIALDRTLKYIINTPHNFKNVIIYNNNKSLFNYINGIWRLSGEDTVPVQLHYSVIENMYKIRNIKFKQICDMDNIQCYAIIKKYITEQITKKQN